MRTRLSVPGRCVVGERLEASVAHSTAIVLKLRANGRTLPGWGHSRQRSWSICTFGCDRTPFVKLARARDDGVRCGSRRRLRGDGVRVRLARGAVAQRYLFTERVDDRRIELGAGVAFEFFQGLARIAAGIAVLPTSCSFAARRIRRTSWSGWPSATASVPASCETRSRCSSREAFCSVMTCNSASVTCRHQQPHARDRADRQDQHDHGRQQL